MNLGQAPFSQTKTFRELIDCTAHPNNHLCKSVSFNSFPKPFLKPKIFSLVTLQFCYHRIHFISNNLHTFTLLTTPTTIILWILWPSAYRCFLFLPIWHHNLFSFSFNFQSVIYPLLLFLKQDFMYPRLALNLLCSQQWISGPPTSTSQVLEYSCILLCLSCILEENSTYWAGCPALIYLAIILIKLLPIS